MIDEVIGHHSDNLILRVSQIWTTEFVSLLKQTVYGTSGVRYQQTGQEVKITELLKPLFFSLWKEQELVGLYCLDERWLELPEGSIRGFYGRYLTVATNQMGRGYGRLLKQQAIAYVQQHMQEPFLLYSYIEERNTRSLSLSTHEGFQPVRTLQTYIFRRYIPKFDARFQKLSDSDLAALMPHIIHFYKDYTLKTFAQIGHRTNYFVLKNGEEVIAGIQATPVRWRFLNMPGIVGWITMHVAPALPMTKRFFNPNSYEFVVIEGLYLQNAQADDLFALMESVLAYFGLYTALWQLDREDPIVSWLSGKQGGWLSGFQSGVSTQVMVKVQGVSDDKLRFDRPAYVSSFDYV